MEYLCLLAEIETLKEENALLRQKDSVCPFITGKGTPCKRKCDGDKNACKIHSRPQKVPKKVCGCVNMRGNPCKRKCVDGKTHCEKHDPSAQKPKKEKKEKMHVEPLVPVDDKKWVGELAFWIARNEPRMI